MSTLGRRRRKRRRAQQDNVTTGGVEAGDGGNPNNSNADGFDWDRTDAKECDQLKRNEKNNNDERHFASLEFEDDSPMYDSEKGISTTKRRTSAKREIKDTTSECQGGTDVIKSRSDSAGAKKQRFVHTKFATDATIACKNVGGIHEASTCTASKKASPRASPGPTNTDEMFTNQNNTPKIPTSLPMLLHLRKVGLSSRSSMKYYTNGCSNESWQALMLQRPMYPPLPYRNFSCKLPSIPQNSNSKSISRYMAKLAQWDCLQYSNPTYYCFHNDDDASHENKVSQSGPGKDIPNSSTGNNIQLYRKEWRPYTKKQCIPFSKLKTPTSDAILALDRFGSYLVGIGSGGNNTFRWSSSVFVGQRKQSMEKSTPYLSLKFYGVPSPAIITNCIDDVSQSRAKRDVTSPLILSIPLLRCGPGAVENRNFPAPASLLGHNEYASPAAETPVQILLSDDGALGVAFLHHSTAAAWNDNIADTSCPTFSTLPSVQNEDILGTVVIFPTPLMLGSHTNSYREIHKIPKQLAKSLHCSNVRIGGWNSFTVRNSLWHTTLIPVKATTHMQCKQRRCIEEKSSVLLCDGIKRVLSAYILFNDEDDGYRITWINVSDADDEDLVYESQTSLPLRPTCEVVTKLDEIAWEICLSEADTGLIHHAATENSCGPEIAHECYLRVDALLSDILQRRQSSLFNTTTAFSAECDSGRLIMPDFFYDLVALTDLRVTVTIVFSNPKAQTNKKAPSCLGVILALNLVDQSYSELKWVQHPSCRGEVQMKEWCKEITMNQRMQDCGAGVFCLENFNITPKLQNWAGEFHECNINDDIQDDFNVQLWADYVKRRKGSNCKSDALPPKHINMSSLYTGSDVITNRAVHNAIPVKKIVCRMSPIELNYG